MLRRACSDWTLVLNDMIGLLVHRDTPVR
jgi:hypothetical protein